MYPWTMSLEMGTGRHSCDIVRSIKSLVCGGGELVASDEGKKYAWLQSFRQASDHKFVSIGIIREKLYKVVEK